MGTDLTPAEASDALEYTSANRSCVVVTLDWLRTSVQLRQPQPPQAGFAIPPSVLQQLPKRQRPAAATAAGAEGGGGGAHALTRVASMGPLGGLERSCSQAVSGDDSALGRAQAPGSRPTGGVFEGCYFTLAAIRGTPDEGRLQQLIPTYGGRLFLPTSVNHVQQSVQDRSRIYAVCPDSLLPATAAQVGGARCRVLRPPTAQGAAAEAL